jgi:hypothetical protein
MVRVVAVVALQSTVYLGLNLMPAAELVQKVTSRRTTTKCRLRRLSLSATAPWPTTPAWVVLVAGLLLLVMLLFGLSTALLLRTTWLCEAQVVGR